MNDAGGVNTRRREHARRGKGGDGGGIPPIRVGRKVSAVAIPATAPAIRRKRLVDIGASRRGVPAPFVGSADDRTVFHQQALAAGTTLRACARNLLTYTMPRMRREVTQDSRTDVIPAYACAPMTGIWPLSQPGTGVSHGPRGDYHRAPCSAWGTSAETPVIDTDNALVPSPRRELHAIGKPQI